MEIGTVKVASRLALAPMAGVTDLGFRTVCRALGCGYTVTEMVSAKALCYQDRKSVPLLKLGEGEHPAAAQIFGSDPKCMEEAAAIAKLIAVYGLSQEQAAERLGKSQSAVANKLRLLRLSPACVALLREGGLSERHARALLRLSDENERLAALRVIVERGCNVAQAEAYIESVLQRAAVTPPRRRPTFIVKDVRLFLNTIRRSMGIMQRAGVDAACEREDTDEEIRLTIRIPRTGAAKTA